MVTPKVEYEPAVLLGNELPKGAQIVTGKRRPRWRRRLKMRHRTGRWYVVDTMAPRSAYQTALKHNQCRILGVDWELAAYEPDDGSESVLYARWNPVQRRVTDSDGKPVE